MTAATDGSSEWYLNEDTLLLEMKKSGVSLDNTPSIQGYTNLREVQRGGQGVVYSALQVSMRRTVAVKVLHPSYTSLGSARRRFEREVELAATLNHPGVVRVYDSGVTADGRLFLSMELVEGDTLDHVALALGRDVRKVCELVAQVCDGLNHAHQHGVIHRDLKPSNIRVGRNGTPIILDFGLASSQASQAMELTVSGAFLGSLPWTSPEQAGGKTNFLDVRSDVYAMGVILYQLLTGVFPYNVDADLRTVLNSVISDEPAPLHKALPGVAEDLEVICTKCLAKDPAQRYQSAAELGEDLRLFVAGEPIRARRERMWSVMSRRLHRYRVLAWSGAAVACIIAGALVTVGVFAQRARVERNQAQLATKRAETTLKFLTGMLEAANPEEAGGGRDVRVAALLDKSAASIDKEFADEPASLVQMHDVLGRTYTALGLYEAAEEHERAALRIAQETEELGPDHPRTLEVEANVADILLQQAKNKEAEAVLVPLIPRMVRVMGEEANGVMLARSELGLSYRFQNRLDEAEAMYRQALSHIDPKAAPTRDVLSVQNNLASALHSKNRLEEAQGIYEKVLEGRLKLDGPDGGETITVLSNLAVLHMDRGHYDRAEMSLRAAWQSSIRVRGADHPTTLSLEHNLAFAVENQKKYDDALELWKDVSTRRETVLGPTHAHTLVSLGNYGSLLNRNGHPEEGERITRLVLERRTQTLGERHLDTLISTANLANMLSSSNRPADAEVLLRRVVELLAPEQGILPEKHWLRAAYKGSLGRSIELQGRYDEAEPLIKESIAELEAKLGPDHPQTKTARGNLEKLNEHRAAAKKT